jgi:hypothetical protein
MPTSGCIAEEAASYGYIPMFLLLQGDYMISEKDLKDFKDIDCTQARAAVKKVIYFRAHEHQYKEGWEVIEELFKKIELLQRNAIKQIPALFKPISGEQ